MRGRAAGEVADLLYNAAIKEGMDSRNVTIIYSADKALETAIEEAKPGDFIVMFYEEFEPALEIVKKYRKIFESKNKKMASGEMEEKQAAG